MTRLFLVMIVLALASCYNGDLEFNAPTAHVMVTRKGCMADTGRQTSSNLIVNVNSETLPDGRVRCVIETVTVKEAK